MKLGTTSMSTLKLGTTQVASAYIGSTLVWSSSVPYSTTVVADAPTVYFRLGETESPFSSSVSGHTLYPQSSVLFSQPGAVAGNDAMATELAGDLANGLCLYNTVILNYTTSAFTIELWVKAAVWQCQAISTKAYIIVRGTMSLNGYELSINSNGQIHFRTNQSGSNQLTSSTVGAAPNNAWIHLVVTRSGTSVKIYVNGSLVNGTSGSHSNPATCSDYMTIGNYQGNGGSSGNISFDEIAFYPTALTQARIQAHYNARNSA